jgi:hypothetical protein
MSFLRNVKTGLLNTEFCVGLQCTANLQYDLFFVISEADRETVRISDMGVGFYCNGHKTTEVFT